MFSKKGALRLKKKKNRPVRSPTLRLEGSEPPPFEYNVIYTKKMRYLLTTAAPLSVGDTVSYTALRSFLVIGTGGGAATTTVLFTKAVRVKKVEMWGPMVAALTPVSISCQFPSSAQAGAASSPPKVFSDTSMGMRAAHIKVHPIVGSLQHDWIANVANADPFMLISGPINTIVDITYEFVPDWSDAATTAGAATLTNNVTGVMYWRTLDNSGFLTPLLGVNTI